LHYLDRDIQHSSSTTERIYRFSPSALRFNGYIKAELFAEKIPLKMDTLKALLGLLSQLTGSHGGISFGIVHFVFAATFFGLLFAFTHYKYRESHSPRERLLLWGFGLGFAREVFMLLLATVQALKWLDPVSLHVVFPPLEHAVRTASLIIVAAAFIRYLLDDTRLTRRYLQVALSATALSYLATFWWWAGFIQANPTSKFGQT
jgi:hypothetical protein